MFNRLSLDHLMTLFKFQKLSCKQNNKKKRKRVKSEQTPPTFLKNDHQYYQQTYLNYYWDLSLMLSTIPAKLEILSLSLREGSAYDLICSISLMKGMQNFGERKFQIQKDQTQYAFGENKLFKFFYTPRLNTRRDVFFRLILTDLQSSQQLGDIPISTHKLIEAFDKNPQAVIEQSAEFFQGVTLHYRIYQAYLQLGNLEPISGFRVSGNATFMENIISRPQQQNFLLKSSYLKKPNKEIKSEESPSPGDLFGGIKLENMNSSTKEKTIQLEDKKVQQQKKENIFSNLLGIRDVNDNGNVKRERRNSGEIPDQNMILSRIFQQVRKVNYEQQRKRHTLSSEHSHEEHHGLSKKMKTVMILIIFGLIMLANDFINDQRGKKKVEKKPKKLKAKKKVSEL